ncbi:MAG: hypothetical protein HC861_00230 [Rhodospirillaceae bacterium]|nr:hypothetical protein [Rhodospirillaceae bacterium]
MKQGNSPNSIEEHVMKLRTLFLCALTAGLTHAGAAPADFTPIEVKLEDKEIGAIEVDGAHLDAYRAVLTKTVSYSLWARGDTPTSQGDTVSNFLLQASEDGAWAAKYEGPLYEDWNKYRISFPYQDVEIKDSGRHLAPIKRCNDRLKQTTGEARKELLFKGATITVQDAYMFRGYVPKDDGGHVDWLYAPVTIKCLPLDHDRSVQSCASSLRSSKRWANSSARWS